MTIQELSQKIGISLGYLSILHIHHDKYYKTYYIKKKYGNKQRLIASPNYEIKAIQSWLLRNILNKVEISDRATGFVSQKNIKDNATYHQEKKFILCVDIVDFFPSIKKDKILERLKLVLNDSDLAYFVSEICTYQNYLPQGGVTSPILSNIVFKPIDDEIKNLCDESGIVYSRYADDLCFSSNYSKELLEIKEKISIILRDQGFELNEDKTRLMTGKYKKIVTGLYLNSGNITVGRFRKRYVRSALYNYYIKKDTNINMNEIYGMISFISGIENDYKFKVKKYIKSLIIKSKLTLN